MRVFLFTLWLLNCLTYAQAQQTIKDLTVQDLKVVSTTKASKPCPLMTQTQRDAIASPLNGQCLYNTTTSKLNVYNGSVWKAAGGGVDAWATATVYAVGDLVIQNDRIYQCLIAHTSGTFATDLAALNWKEISAMTGVDLTTNQTIGGTKTFSNTIVGSVNGNAATVTTNANLTGAVTSTGNATLLGSFSSSNLLTALSDETGTGASVFAGSPTFTGSPNISTATGTSLVLGGTINANAVADFQSTTKAFMPPRMTNAQMIAIASPASGMVVFNTDFGMLASYNGTSWTFGTSNLNLDNTYSAKVSVTGAISDANKSAWLSCTNSVGVATCTYAANLVTLPMNCVAIVNENSTNVFAEPTSSSTGFVFQNNTAGTSRPFTVICQKSGIDYANSSSQAYSQASSNYSRVAYTPTITGLGTVTNLDCLQSRNGEYLDVECSLTSGTVTGVNLSITLPSGLAVASNIADATTGYALVGQWARGATSTLAMTIVAAPAGTSVFASLYGGGVRGAITPAFGTDVGSSEAQSFRFRVPIQGWSNASQIVGSFAGYGKVPGVSNSATPNVDIFSVSFGTTDLTTRCTASPCFIDQIGTAVSSLVRAGAGDYTLNTNRTYSKLKCTANAKAPGADNIIVDASINCLSCNGLTGITTRARTTGLVTDSYGTISCMGSY